MTGALETARVYAEVAMASPERHLLPDGEVVVFTCPSPCGAGPNEDAAVVMPLSGGSVILALADGAGGHPSGTHASQIALNVLTGCVAERIGGGASPREAVMEAFERANEAVAQNCSGSATTLAVAVVEGRQLQTFHTGDSAVLIVSQRGRLKALTVSHSPVGYAETAGYLDEEQAMSHAERHLVSNMVGLAGMTVEVAAPRPLAARDTIVIASDGLLDNLYVTEITRRVSRGALGAAVHELATEALERMAAPQPGRPSKPDDLTIVAFRPRSPSHAGSAKA